MPDIDPRLRHWLDQPALEASDTRDVVVTLDRAALGLDHDPSGASLTHVLDALEHESGHKAQRRQAFPRLGVVRMTASRALVARLVAKPFVQTAAIDDLSATRGDGRPSRRPRR